MPSKLSHLSILQQFPILLIMAMVKRIIKYMKYKSNNSLIGIVYINAKKYKQGHGIIKIGYWCRREIREKTNHKTENQRYYI